MTLDRPENPQDNTSVGEQETSETTQTFTKEQVEERERKAKSDALADIGRYKKSADNAIKAAQAAEERINRMLKQQEEDELAAHSDEPDRLAVIRERQTRRTAESELAKTKQELEEEKAKTQEAQQAEAKSTQERNAREIATRLGVDAKTLMKFTDGSTEAMEELAKVLPKKGEARTLTPDSGKTTGGGKTFKESEILTSLDPSKMTPAQIHEKVMEFEKAKNEGKIKSGE